jgi:hypothetical protein
MDLVLHFRQDEVGLTPDSHEACIAGETVAGVPFEGCAGVRVIVPGGGR